MKGLTLGLALITLTLAGACGSDPEPPPATPADIPPPPPPPPPPPSEEKDDDGSRAQLNISEDILAACGISAAEASFAYDSARVRQGDAPVLDKLAECFTTGKLAGRKMRLVGHADPRGDEEYNMVLGGRRAESVKSYLLGAGLKQDQAQTTSRGEMDAQGTDEAGWARDRRVDILLAD